MSTVTGLLAHQGGWDEILLVGAPIVAIIGMLVVVKRRVDSQMPDEPASGPAASEPPPN